MPAAVSPRAAPVLTRSMANSAATLCFTCIRMEPPDRSKDRYLAQAMLYHVQCRVERGGSASAPPHGIARGAEQHEARRLRYPRVTAQCRPVLLPRGRNGVMDTYR